MPGDYSRKLFDQKKHYSAVLEQQGRVQLDADWNEQADLQQYRIATETKDVIGLSGVPKKNGGFKITLAANGAGLAIAPGRIYVNGLLFELDEPATYQQQPHYLSPDLQHFHLPGSPASPPASPAGSPPSPGGLKQGAYIVYLEGWQRERTYLDDPRIQEVALGEADTTTRLQNVWQVKLLKVGDGSSAATCNTSFTAWNDLIAPPTGKLNAQTVKNTDKKEPCALPPTAGYRRLENQLYRVQVIKGGDRSTATFAWSRDNASVETSITGVSGSVLTVADVGKDEILGFAGNQWVEIVESEPTLSGVTLVQIDAVKPGVREIVLKTSVSQFETKKGLKLRRWDMTGSALQDGLAMQAGWTDIEGGIQVQFSDGTYKSGDYWLIPARTATSDIEWPVNDLLQSIEQSPVGINRHYAKLAVVNAPDDVEPVIEDCRLLFPALTELTAEDIAFNNTHCKLGGADTVQEALDMLCSANDLRLHNKLLHGYGVICGLKVICGPMSERGIVYVENGHALDCDGNMIKLNTDGGLQYNIVAQAAAQGLLDNSGNGVVCMKITGGGNNAGMLSIEKYVKKGFFEEIMEGTLLMDFYNDCIKKLLLFVQNQLPFPLTDAPPVSLKQRRLTALVNLLAQMINASSGPYGFISGVRKQRSDNDCIEANQKDHEDDLLYCFYDMLRKLIASETYCAQFDHDKYPDYDADPGLDTIFGPPLKMHRRMKLHPNGNVAYTYGVNNKVYVYDLPKRELIQTITFPGSASIDIQDVAISANNDIYAVGKMGVSDSEFAVGALSGSGKITWNGTSVHCGMLYKRLAISNNGRLFASAAGKGVYEIKGINTAGFTCTLIRNCNATGLLHYHSSGTGERLFAAVSMDATLSTFEQVEGFLLANPAQMLVYKIAGTDGGDDIITDADNVYISGTASSKRVVGKFNIVTPGSGMMIDVNEPSSIIHLGIEKERNLLLIVLSDKYKVSVAPLKPSGQITVRKDFRIPVQLFPMTIACTPDRKRAYVLNAFVNTITDIDLAAVFSTSNRPDFTIEKPENLKTYRNAAVAAYAKLFNHLLQSLKDCFCDKFLIDCPTCNEKNAVYLGCVDIRNNKVYHICNFTKRKYVKSFPTVEYWLSTVPVLPVIKKLFTTFCCMVIDKSNKP